jgi:IS5 family transposase
MVKILLIQKLNNSSDIQAEREIRGRKYALNFLGYHEKLPDRNIIWYFRESLSKTGRNRLVFSETEDHTILSKRIHIDEGTMQDVSSIERDKGEYGKFREDEAKTRRAMDGASVTKNNMKHFDYRAHTLVNELK